MNNGIFSLGSPQTFPATNSSRNLLGIPSKIDIPYGFPQGKIPQVNYDNIVLVIDTTKESTNIVTLPIQGTVNCTVDWGDGSTDRYISAGNRTHTYASRGEYTIQIYGSFTALTFSSTTNNKAKIIRCLSFGNLPLTSLNFTDCTNLIQVPNNLPTGITSLLDCFRGCFAFNQSVDGWDISRVTNLYQTFYYATSFNRDLNSWNTSNVTNMAGTFNNAQRFNGVISNWDVSKATALNSMFQSTPFNQPISGWNIGGSSSVNTITMSSMFAGSSFNQPLTNWDISKVNNFSSMFTSSNFNASLSGWQIGSGTGVTSVDMTFMFNGAAAFNNSVADWKFYKPTNMNNSFYNTAAFNDSSITGWINTSGITNMGNMFYNNRVFNQPIGSWDTRNVTSMGNMFNFSTAFNQSLNSWDVSKVTTFAGMFASVNINQPFNNWDIKGITATNGIDSFLTGATLSVTNYNDILIAWESRKSTYRSDLRPHFGASKYTAGSAAATARAALVSYGWTITDGGSI